MTDEISPRQLAAIGALLSCDSQIEAAEKVKVNPRTLRRWMGEDPFRRELGRQRSRLITDALNVLAAASNDAAAVLRSVANNGRSAPAPRVAAARAILDFAAGLDERSSLLERVEELERGLKDANFATQYRRPS
jgi:hypothetical protein